MDLLQATNQYAASALIRQLVEVEYLASAFAEEHDIAAEWLRTDRDERLKFWSLLKTDCWHHCDMGGHPATPAMSLLPGHKGIHVGYLWTDLAGHFVGIWMAVVQSTERLLGGAAPAEWELADVQSAIDRWHRTDGLRAAMHDLGVILREDSRAPRGDASVTRPEVESES